MAALPDDRGSVGVCRAGPWQGRWCWAYAYFDKRTGEPLSWEVKFSAPLVVGFGAPIGENAESDLEELVISSVEEVVEWVRSSEVEWFESYPVETLRRKIFPVRW